MTSQLIEKSLEYNKRVVVIFIDIENSYDSVNRERFWEEMKKIGIGDWYIYVIKTMYRGRN